MNPRAMAATVAGTVAAATLVVVSVDLFLLATVIALVVWLAVTVDQRDEALTDYAGLLFENAELRAEVERLDVECEALNQENMRLHLELTEAQLWAGGGPKLRVVPSPRTGSHDDLPAADESWIADAGLFRDSNGRWS